MKIVQQINLESAQVSSESATFELLNERIYWDPANYTGIVGIYFQVNTKYIWGAAEGEIELYDITNSQTIATVTINEENWTRHLSADIQASLTEAKILGLRMKRTSGSDFNAPATLSASLIVIQDDSTASRKTAMYYVGFNYYETSSFASWASNSAYQFIPKISDCDGTVKVTIEAYLKAASGGQAMLRLYDLTTAEAVSGSEVTTNETSYIRAESGELTLNSSHKYTFQCKSGVNGKYAYIATPVLKIVCSGFNKVASLCIVSGLGTNEAASGWSDFTSKEYFFRGYIDGTDSLTFGLGLCWYNYVAGHNEWNQRLYNITAAEAVTGTTEAKAIDTSQADIDYLTPTMPPDYSEIVGQADSAALDSLGPFYIYAFQQENLPSTPNFPADPTQPTGYHCFMSQFIRNMLAGYIPLLTPDGVNKCWS